MRPLTASRHRGRLPSDPADYIPEGRVVSERCKSSCDVRGRRRRLGADSGRSPLSTATPAHAPFRPFADPPGLGASGVKRTFVSVCFSGRAVVLYLSLATIFALAFGLIWELSPDAFDNLMPQLAVRRRSRACSLS